LDKIRELEGVAFKMKKFRKSGNQINPEEIDDPVKRKTVEADMAMSESSIPEADRYGFIAQELRKTFPELVDENEEGYLNVDYIGLIPVLVEAIKELQVKVETLENDCCNDSGNLKSASADPGNDFDLNGNAAKLYQNTPNPFTGTTQITYYLPTGAGQAAIYIYDMNGTQLKSIPLNQTGENSITIYGYEFRAGMYLYSLLVGGELIDTKRMVLTD
jgi:hypothetical protein